MNKDKSIVVVTSLVVGLLLGYILGGGGGRNVALNNMHRMPDGSMMGNNTHDMGMTDMMSSMNKELVGKKGDEFDQAFLREMIVHHEGAVEMAELALKNAKHEEIKSLAREIITAQNKEIGDMKSWLKAWYNQSF